MSPRNALAVTLSIMVSLLACGGRVAAEAAQDESSSPGGAITSTNAAGSDDGGRQPRDAGARDAQTSDSSSGSGSDTDSSQGTAAAPPVPLGGDGPDSSVQDLASLQGSLMPFGSYADQYFGGSVALSADGSTLAISDLGDRSGASGIDGSKAITSAADVGAVYVFVRDNSTWLEQAYIKASNAQPDTWFGTSIGLSADGNTLVIGARGESSNAGGIDGDQQNTLAESAGAAYVFSRAGAKWTQEAYVKASDTRAHDGFGAGVATSGDGNTFAVATHPTASFGGTPNPSAVYVFARSGTTWQQFAEVAVPTIDPNPYYGYGSIAGSVAFSWDGTVLALGARGVDADASATDEGAVVVLTRSDTGFATQSVVHPASPQPSAFFGASVALSSDGSGLVVGAWGEGGNAGAAYVFRNAGGSFAQEARVTASSAGPGAYFGCSVAIANDGNTIAVGSFGETSGGSGLGDATGTSYSESGAAYVYVRDPGGASWSQRFHVKAPSPSPSELFGYSVALSGTAATLAVDAFLEADRAGAVSVFH
jgi:hypothetical protein